MHNKLPENIQDSSQFNYLSEPVPLLSINTDAKSFSRKINFNTKDLKTILLNPLVASKMVYVLSMTGSKKSGKSLLMNFCLRYLTKQNVDNFISCKERLSGFKWGCEEAPDSFCIYMWNKPFFINTVDKGTVAVILIDSHDHYSDQQVSIKEMLAMKSLVKLFSSLEIYNFLGQIHEADLSWLGLISEFCKICKSKCDKQQQQTGKYFQSLCFVIRDWPYPYEYFYGFGGGQQYLNRHLTELFKKRNGMSNFRYPFDITYSSVNCFLMPVPSSAIINSESFSGNWELLSPDFQEYILNFFETIFSSAFICPKEVNNHLLTGDRLYTALENYYETVISQESMIPLSTYQVISQRSHYEIFIKAVDVYNDMMMNRNKYSTTSDDLLKYHKICKTRAVEYFRGYPKYGSRKMTETYREKIEKYVNDNFIKFYAFNSTYPIAMTHILPVNVISMFFFCIIKSIIKPILISFIFVNSSDIIDNFVIFSVCLLLLYNFFSLQLFYRQLNINAEVEGEIHSGNI